MHAFLKINTFLKDLPLNPLGGFFPLNGCRKGTHEMKNAKK